MFTPKNIYGKEPYLIFLNEMEGAEKHINVNEKRKVFLKKFINTYEDKTKIMFPKDMNELEECIDVWEKEQTESWRKDENISSYSCPGRFKRNTK